MCHFLFVSCGWLWIVRCGMVLIETGELYVHLYYDIGICEEEKKGGGES